MFEIIKQVRQGSDLEITHPRSTAIVVPRDQRRWGQLARDRQRLTLKASGTANNVVWEGGVVPWTKGIMKTARRASGQYQYTSNCQGLRPCLDLLAAAHANVWQPSP